MELDTNKHSEMLGIIFCKHLKEIREERGMSQSKIAKKLGCAVSTYANWEQGRREPSILDLYKLMWVFEIDANELFDIDYYTSIGTYKDNKTIKTLNEKR